MPLCKGDQESVEYAIRETYWEGLDLIPASASLFAAEFELPARQMTSRGERFEFWNVLNNGIEQARLDYDVIIIDTPLPSPT
ncbi:MAG: AAA family ATPase [Aquincola sp.]|nr:AAA family ATPase [Aquincola sp.]